VVCTSNGNGRVVDAELVELERGQPVPETLVYLALELREYQYGSFAIVGSHGFSVLILCTSFFFSLVRYLGGYSSKKKKKKKKKKKRGLGGSQLGCFSTVSSVWL
jgi:hypothetical protein